jgi:hypothetical protein
MKKSTAQLLECPEFVPVVASAAIAKVSVMVSPTSVTTTVFVATSSTVQIAPSAPGGEAAAIASAIASATTSAIAAGAAVASAAAAARAQAEIQVAAADALGEIECPEWKAWGSCSLGVDCPYGLH